MSSGRPGKREAAAEAGIDFNDAKPPGLFILEYLDIEYPEGPRKSLRDGGGK